MISFIKWALREIRHVVWPTRKETQKYFGLVLMMLIAFGLYLFIASNVFSTLIFGLKDIIRDSEEVEFQSIDEINQMLGNDLEIPLVSDEVSVEIGTDSTEVSEDEEGETITQTAE